MMTDPDARLPDAYRDDLDRTPRFAPGEEAALYERLRAGDPAARSRLAEGHLRLVLKIARHYRRQRVLAPGDVIQEGNIGLLLAIDRFQPAVGCRFSTYAAFWIHYTIQQALRRSQHIVSLPVRKARLADKAAAEMRRRAAEGRDIGLEDLAALLGTTSEDLAALLAARQAALSLDQAADGGGGAGGGWGATAGAWGGDGAARATIGDRVAAEGVGGAGGGVATARGAAAGGGGGAAATGGGACARRAVLRRQVAGRLREALATLPERERDVVIARYGLDGAGEERSLRETGERVGLSQEGVRLIERRAIDRLRRRARLADVARDAAAAWAA